MKTPQSNVGVRRPQFTGQGRGALTFPRPDLPGAAATRMLLVGTGRPAVRAFEELRRMSVETLIAGVIDLAPPSEFSAAVPELLLPARIEDLQRTILHHCIDEVHVALPADSAQRLKRIRAATEQLGVALAVHQRPTPYTGRRPITFFHRHASVHGGRAALKRAIDLGVAAAALVALSPLFVLIAAAIKLTSAGPVFFRQPRIGRGRRQFLMLKFRTMVENAEELRHAVQSLNCARVM